MTSRLAAHQTVYLCHCGFDTFTHHLMISCMCNLTTPSSSSSSFCHHHHHHQSTSSDKTESYQLFIKCLLHWFHYDLTWLNHFRLDSANLHSWQILNRCTQTQTPLTEAVVFCISWNVLPQTISMFLAVFCYLENMLYQSIRSVEARPTTSLTTQLSAK